MERTDARAAARFYHPSRIPGRRRPGLYVGTEPDKGMLLTHIARRRESVRFLVARGGRDGRQMAIDSQPRIVVVEGQLPDVDALEFVSELRRHIMAPRAPIVVLAHEATPKERARFIWAGASAYVSEPFNSTQICRTVGLLLDSVLWR
jgi:two-component system, chemotaxis family, chemotaxis protein CheY